MLYVKKNKWGIDIILLKIFFTFLLIFMELVFELRL